jgi:hypothetical protein
MASQTVALQEPSPSKSMTPTSAAPGSAEKIRVMASRVANGQPIHHEHDAKSNDYRRVAG